MRNRLPSGHGWAYLGVALGLIASVAGNVANTVLTESEVHLALRVPFAVAWPVFVGIGIEVLTRVEWERNWRHWGARAFLMGPMTLVAGFMSYLHLHHLMILSGEPGLAQAVGPLAVDGTLFGCTVALLVTRSSHRSAGQEEKRQTLAQRVAALKTSVTDTIDVLAAPKAAAISVEDLKVQDLPALEDGTRWSTVPTEDPTTVLVPEAPVPNYDPTPEVLEDPAPVSPAPAGTRRPRGTVDYAKVLRLVQELPKDGDVAERLTISVKTPQRVRRAVRLMDTTTDLAAIASTVKLPLAAVQTIAKELKG